MMPCLHRAAPTTTRAARRTTLGCRMFRCRACRWTSNECTSTPFNHPRVPTDVVVLVVPGRLQYMLSLRNVAEMFLTRGFTYRASDPEGNRVETMLRRSRLT